MFLMWRSGSPSRFVQPHKFSADVKWMDDAIPERLMLCLKASLQTERKSNKVTMEGEGQLVCVRVCECVCARTLTVIERL